MSDDDLEPQIGQRSVELVRVHADGGKCHGTILARSPQGGWFCPVCLIAPDMQSIELWQRKDARP